MVSILTNEHKYDTMQNMFEQLRQHETAAKTAASLAAAAAIASFAGEAKAYSPEDANAEPAIEATFNIPEVFTPSGSLSESLAESSGMTPEQYNYAKKVLNRLNSGPAEMNVIETGGVLLMPGTQVYKAPMKGAIDHVINKQHREFWSLYRLAPINGELWIAARNAADSTGHTDEVLGSDWATDPKYSRWVKISQAEKVKGFGHYEPLAPGATVNRWNLPHVYAIRPNDQHNIMITQPHPEELSDPRYLATYSTIETKQYKQTQYMPGPNSILFQRTKRPVRFEKAKIRH
jgi:hypothetical protein